MCTHVKPLLQSRRRSCPSPAGCPVPFGPSPPPPQTAAKPASFALDGFPYLELYGRKSLCFFWSHFFHSTQLSRDSSVWLCAWFVLFLPHCRNCHGFFLHSPVDRWDPSRFLAVTHKAAVNAPCEFCWDTHISLPS